MAETFDWIKPSLLWQPAARDMLQPDFFRPALLEFRSDDFVKDFLALAGGTRPDAMTQAIARPLKVGRPLKFFQPAHGNFYLTCASLCCRMPGFPDRAVQKDDGESTFFILRKKANGKEYGWVANGTSGGWLAVNGKPILDNEDRLPLFPALTGRNRNLFFGYVPVSSQQTYAAEPAESPVQTGDARLDELDGRFIEPLQNPLSFSIHAPPPLTVTIRRISIYLLLDLVEYLDSYLPEVGAALRAQPNASPNSNETALLTWLQAQMLNAPLTLRGALSAVARKQTELNEPGDSDLAALGFDDTYSLSTSTITSASSLAALRTTVANALRSRPETLPPPVKVPKLGQKAEDLYVLRYVYERPQCDPPHLYVSQPTEPFELAPFFDPDAPGRPIRIGLPVDVSIAGLRKFPKNVAFMMSKELRNKMGAINKGMLKGDPPGTYGDFDIGHICSFSIPIITLIAFILLMLIAILLNIVFWWLPLLKICFPLKLEAKP